MRPTPRRDVVEHVEARDTIRVRVDRVLEALELDGDRLDERVRLVEHDVGEPQRANVPQQRRQLGEEASRRLVVPLEPERCELRADGLEDRVDGASE